MQKILLLFPLWGIASAMSLLHAETQVLSSNFSQAEVKGYANGDTIGASSVSQLTAHSGTYDGTTSSWNSAAGSPEVKISEANGHRVLDLSEGTAISKAMPDSAGQVRGSLIFTILPVAEGRTAALILLTKDSWFTSGGANLFSLEISSSLALRFPGGTVPDRLKPDTRYRIDFSVDCSNAEQHTWDFTLYEGGGADKVLFTSPAKMKTRHATTAPNTFVIHQLAGSASGALLQFEKINLSTTP